MKPMHKMINEPDAFVDEMLEGILCAHSDELRPVDGDRKVLVRNDAGSGQRVGIVTGGGSGHLPVFLGYVGKGLCSGVAVGNVFSSPSAEQMYAATRAVDTGAGVLYLYGNYGGDVLNFDLAGDMAEADDIRTETVLVTDDVASAPAGEEENRRGVAGLVFAYKCAGAAAERGQDLDEVTAVARKVVDNTRTMGVGLSPAILPSAGKPTFEIDDDEMEIGVGIHGEPGVHRGKRESADAIADRLVSAISEDLKLSSGEEVAVLVNGLGSTPPEELYILFRRVYRHLSENSVKIHRNYIGEYATSLEMAGASVTVMRLDDELKELMDAPASSPFFKQ